MKYAIKYTVLCGLFLSYFLSLQAQQRVYDTVTIKLFDDIEAIQAMYVSTDHISFTATYYMEDIDSVTIRDTSVAQFKINGQKFHLMIDSVESIQNDHWFGTVYYQNFIVVVQQPVPLPKQVLGVNVKDSLFQQIVMDQMTFVDSGSYRRINIICNDNSPFISYNVVFNKTNYQVTTINYTLRKNMDKASIKKVNMQVRFSAYSSGTFDDTVFSTDNFFLVKNGREISAGSAIPGFEVVNLIQKQ